MNFKFKLIALLLTVMMFLSSCSVTLDSILNAIPGLRTEQTTTTTTTTTTKRKTTTTTTKKKDDTVIFNRSENSVTPNELLERYTLTQEEVEAALALIDQMVEGGMPDPEGDPNVAVMTMEEWDAVYTQFEEAFYYIAQQMTIASIIYYCDMTNEASSERHLSTQEQFYDIQDAYNIALRELYLGSPMKDQLFEGWSDEDIREMLEYNPEVMELRKQIEELTVQFDNLEDDHLFDTASVDIYKQIVILNNQLARLNNCDNYYTYASKNVYGRDYEADDLAIFRQYVLQYIVPNFTAIKTKFEGWRDTNNLSESRQQTFMNFMNDSFDAGKKNYLTMYLDSLEGTMGENMRHMFENRNCVFANSSNSHPSAFQTYLYKDETPFCLFGHDGQTASTMVHEIGHYYAAVTDSDLNNYDLCETHSQGNEFLFAKFCESKLGKSVYTYVRAYNVYSNSANLILYPIIDEFEQRVYALSDEEINAMTSEDFDALMAEVCEPYGGLTWVDDNIADPNYYWRRVVISNPVYYISYAVSVSAALQIYAMAEEDYDAAIETYTALVEKVDEEHGFLGALEIAGLYSPFDEETFKIISGMMQK